MTEEKTKKKKLYSFKFDSKFKEELDMVASVLGISTTALIEQECGRLLRSLKKAINDKKRKDEIESQLLKERKERKKHDQN